MTSSLYHLLRSLRLRQWLKNLSLYAGAVFGGRLFELEQLIVATKAFIIFCGLSSAMYLLNDVVDAPKDRHHHFKKFRPIASGKVSIKLALLISFILLSLSLLSARELGKFFFLASLSFILLQVSYTLLWKNFIIIDALAVSGAFIIRFYAGALAISASLSSWLVLTTIGASLLLAFGKRRCERTLLTAHGIEKVTRATLKHYPDTLLDAMISMSSAFTIIAYAFFTFQISPTGTSPLFIRLLPPILAAPKWMMLTIPLVIYGVGRYLYVIYEKKEGESPERVLLSDWPLLLTFGLWGISLVAVLYGAPTR